MQHAGMNFVLKESYIIVIYETAHKIAAAENKTRIETDIMRNSMKIATFVKNTIGLP